MKYVIRSEGYAQPYVTGGAVGKYLEWFDPTKDGPGGEEMGGWTVDPGKAKTFDSRAEALDFWRTPMLKDGKPVVRADGALDRPLTAFTIEVVPLDTVLAEHEREPDLTPQERGAARLLDAILKGGG